MVLADFIAFFKSVELLEDLGDEELRMLAQLATLQTYAAGDSVCRQHEPLEDLLLVKSGRLIVWQQNAQGNKQALTSFWDGEFINESCIISQTKEIEHYATAQTIQESTIIHFDRHRFMDLLKQHGSMSVKVYSKVAKIIARRLQNANSRSGNVTYLYRSKNRRIEHDLLGDKEVAAESYYGVQTLRALENFDMSGIRLNLYPYFVNALAMVKKSAVLANHELGLIATDVKEAIVQACDEICMGALHNQFIVDMIQGGAGTSTNMNANEVIANRALEILGKPKGEYSVCHPNNHVNLSQSTNDAYPTAIKIATILYNEDLVQVLRHLIATIDRKAEEFRSVIKMGRTQLQDAVPMTLGQTFKAFSSSLKEEVVNQIAFKVIGNDLCVTMASEAGQLELNVMEPVIVECLFSSMEMLKNGMQVLADQCLSGTTANVERCQAYVQNSIGLATALNPYLGYETSTILAKEALETDRGIYELVLEKQLMTKADLDEILKPENMLGPYR